MEYTEIIEPKCPNCGTGPLQKQDGELTNDTEIICPRCGSIGTFGELRDRFQSAEQDDLNRALSDIGKSFRGS